MDWSNEQTLFFIGLYEQYPVLWDLKHPDRKNRSKCHEAWMQIQKEFDDSISVVDLKRKKESLMASYRCLRRKVWESEAMGTETESVFKPSWYAFEAIDRFMKVKGERNSLTNFEDDWTCVTQLNEEEIQNNDEVESASMIHENSQVDSHPIIRSQEKNQLNTNSPHKRRKGPPLTDISIARSLKEASKALTTLSSRQSQQTDQCSMFGQIIAEQLRQLSPKNRIIIQSKISNVVKEALLQELEHPPLTKVNQDEEHAAKMRISKIQEAVEAERLAQERLKTVQERMKVALLQSEHPEIAADLAEEDVE